MSVSKFGGPRIYNNNTSDISRKFVENNFIRRNGSSAVTGSIDMTGNTLHNVGDPTVDQDVATKAYVDSNSPVKIFSAYVPPLLSGYGVPNIKTGFIVSASSSYGDSYIPSYAFSSYYVGGGGIQGDWLRIMSGMISGYRSSVQI